MRRWRLGVAALALVAWFLLVLAAPPTTAGALTSAVVLLALAGWIPPPPVTGAAALFDISVFRLPGPLDASLGRTLLLALAAVTMVSVLSRPRPRLRPIHVAAVTGVLTPLLLVWIRAGASAQVLAAGQGAWVAYQATTTTVVAAVVASCLALVRPTERRRGLSAAALATAGLVAAVGALMVWTRGAIPWGYASAVALPAGLAAASAAGWTGWRRTIGPWILATLVAGAVTVPVAWSDRVEARMAMGAERLTRLAASSDADLEDDLYRVAGAADSLDARGDDGVELLYAALRRSGLAEAGHPVWMTLWSAAAVPQEELRVGVGPQRPAAADAAALMEDVDGPLLLQYDGSGARYVMRVPLRDDRILTVTAPHFADGGGRSPLAPLLAGGVATAEDPLTLIPLALDDERREDPLAWVRTETGWQGELALVYPDAAYHAHYAVSLPGALLALARGTLLATLNAVLVLLFWLAGRGLLRESLPPEARIGGLVISFQARVTLALFGFFVLANAIFGTVAYRTIAGASHRAAIVLADRVAEDAAGWYFEESGAMELLARRVGAELLEYRQGELREGSVEELVELGLYEGWIPFATHRVLDGREGIRATVEATLGRWEYVTSYRRLPDGDLLAAQIPLQAGATAVRSSDVLQLLGFAVLVGALLSFGLALLVGRTLTRPIQALQVASERVGAGNLELRLPDGRTDEFGAVFRAFNRMVNRLRRARRQLVRQTRRTQAVMEEAAVGMVALDPGGRVTMVNPRAEALLDSDVALGSPIPAPDRLGEELRTWVDAFLGSDALEAGAELHLAERRIRVRARRLEAPGTPGGVVLALEDVTDELRAERVLAWGEMARQVAHEVKNPLTPMKLSIQHIRRAWDDGRDDFGDILVRNADAMLSEIDRLAAIATSFSRFGAPGGAVTADVGAVDAAAAVREILALYGASDDGIRFVTELEGDLPQVRSRGSELKEVLVNLFENARDALHGEGTVVVRARRSGDNRVRLEVEDDGVGIPGDVILRVFEPRFSTRSGGTGLGLAIVRRLVESWGGEIQLASEPGNGTTVTLTLRVARS